MNPDELIKKTLHSYRLYPTEDKFTYRKDGVTKLKKTVIVFFFSLL